MELVHIVAGRLTGRTVGRDAAPDLILNDQHAELFQLLPQFLNVIADETVPDIDVGSVVEKVQGALDIDFERGCHTMGFLFLLL